ncbi:UbiD family decarboxylase [Salinigranum sp.]|uniref:UbiD family decarboxylase n=1 Tax=Salinigranum sp. TaxID=1966351 RepID=UPI0035613306
MNALDFRASVERLDADGDLLRVDERLAGGEEPFAVASEAARANGPAVLFTDVPGTGRLVSGVRGGPDQTVQRSRLPWRRCVTALGLDADAPYRSLLRVVRAAGTEPAAVEEAPLEADRAARDVTALCLPVSTPTSAPLVTTGIASTTVDGETQWAPVRGVVEGRTTLRLSVPERFAEAASDGPAALALGVPTAATLAAHLQATGARPWRDRDTPTIAAALGTTDIAPVDGGLLPASAEVVVEGTATAESSPPPGPSARWERTVPTATLSLSVARVATRADPLLPCVPLGTPLADDVHVTSVVESARLSSRVNGYWGVSPVEWVWLPVESGLGLCLVASELLYAGFEWQLANTLFSFSSSFDKIVILDADSSVENLARALDDMWVKAHPSHDWHFSDPAAPAATAPRYRRDGETGSRLYVNAAWDPQWDEEYIAPRVTFETMYPAELQEGVRERWESLGFDPVESEEGTRE